MLFPTRKVGYHLKQGGASYERDTALIFSFQQSLFYLLPFLDVDTALLRFGYSSTLQVEHLIVHF